MKNRFIICSLTLLFAFFLGCEKEQSKAVEVNKVSWETLVNQYNLKYAKLPELIDYAFVGEGTISTQLKTTNEDNSISNFLEVSYNGTTADPKNKELRFKIGVSENILEGIEKVKIAFFNDQFFLTDLSSNETIRLFVPTDMEAMAIHAPIKVVYEADYIGIFNDNLPKKSDS